MVLQVHGRWPRVLGHGKGGQPRGPPDSISNPASPARGFRYAPARPRARPGLTVYVPEVLSPCNERTNAEDSNRRVSPWRRFRAPVPTNPTPKDRRTTSHPAPRVPAPAPPFAAPAPLFGSEPDAPAPCEPGDGPKNLEQGEFWTSLPHRAGCDLVLARACLAKDGCGDGLRRTPGNAQVGFCRQNRATETQTLK